MVNTNTLILIILAMALITGVSAVPTTSVSMVGPANATITCGSTTGTVGWLEYGTSQQSNTRTWNKTITGSSFTQVLSGGWMYPQSTYYVRCCDTSGCTASKSSFTTIALTTTLNMAPVEPYFNGVRNITENALAPDNFLWNALQPYIQVTGLSIFVSLILSMLFVGSWLQVRGTSTATIMGMICVSLFVLSTVGLGLGISPEFVIIGQGLLYSSIAGMVLFLLFK